MPEGFPANCPYEDGWKFCSRCQRFYKAIKHVNRCQKCSFPLRRISNQKETRMHYVNHNGLGIPSWFYLGYMVSENKQKFLNYRNSVMKIIRDSSVGIHTFRELGLKEYQSHWFIKKD